MREILFRGKRINDSKWAEGSLLRITIGGNTYTLIFGDCFSFDGFDVKSLEHGLVDSDTVGQYTGLLDKGNNRIFEGDIIKTKRYGKLYLDVTGSAHQFSNVNDYDVFCVRYHSGVFRLERENPPRGFNLVSGSELEVIGNIYDNPELLEGGMTNGN